MSSHSIVLNMDEAIDRMGDKDIFLEIARYFASRLPEAIEELRLALEAGETEQATRYAHSMKSNCAAVGAEDLREQCRELEAACRRGAVAEASALYSSLVPELLALRAILQSL